MIRLQSGACCPCLEPNFRDSSGHWRSPQHPQYVPRTLSQTPTDGSKLYQETQKKQQFTGFNKRMKEPNGLCSHGENTGSSPVGVTNDFKRIAAKNQLQD
jgi:hypothetical protein